MVMPPSCPNRSLSSTERDDDNLAVTLVDNPYGRLIRDRLVVPGVVGSENSRVVVVW